MSLILYDLHGWSTMTESMEMGATFHTVKIISHGDPSLRSPMGSGCVSGLTCREDTTPSPRIILQETNTIAMYRHDARTR